MTENIWYLAGGGDWLGWGGEGVELRGNLSIDMQLEGCHVDSMLPKNICSHELSIVIVSCL